MARSDTITSDLKYLVISLNSSLYCWPNDIICLMRYDISLRPEIASLGSCVFVVFSIESERQDWLTSATTAQRPSDDLSALMNRANTSREKTMRRLGKEVKETSRLLVIAVTTKESDGLNVVGGKLQSANHQ